MRSCSSSSEPQNGATVVVDLARRRLLQPDQHLEQGALAATGTAHDDEDVTALDRESQVLLHDEVAVGNRDVIHHDVCVVVTQLRCPG